MRARPPIYGLLAEFTEPNALVAAAARAVEAGYKRLDAFTPFPVEGLAEVIGFREKKLPRLVFAGGVAGALIGYGLQYWSSVLEYPLNIGGRPYHSWPSFIPVTFEMTILVAAFTAVLGMLALNGLPMPYHPLFNAPGFERATRDRFFLLIDARDPKFDLEGTSRFLRSLDPRQVVVVEP